MRTLTRILFLCICFSISLSLAAQQTKTKTKTEAGKTKTKKEVKTTTARTDTTMQSDTLMQITTTTQGGGGGTGTMAPYTATYSSQFAIGNPEHANMVLILWKDYDDNMLDRNAMLFADTITLQAASGQVFRGRDSVIRAIKQMRSQYTSVKSAVEAVMPLRSTDRNEDWVAIWGREDDTNATGTTSNSIHEIWRVNKDGKIDFMRQYTAKPSVQ